MKNGAPTRGGHCPERLIITMVYICTQDICEATWKPICEAKRAA